MKKKLLLITYYWPPAGGISVHRWVKYVKYLHRKSWDITVYAPENPNYPSLDQEKIKELPEGITVIKRPIKEPQKFLSFLSKGKKKEYNPIHDHSRKPSIVDKLLIWLRSNLFIPDTRSLWIKPSVSFLTKYLKNNPVDIIVTNAPPHSTSVIGTRLSNKTGIPFHADFRDPWTQVYYFDDLRLSSGSIKKHKKLEKECFEASSSITIASPICKPDLESIGAENVTSLLTGYDDDDFSGIEVLSPDRFIISHAGLLRYDRNPETFFRALRSLCDSVSSFEDKLELRFAGFVDSQIIESIKKYSLEKHLKILGNISHHEVIKQICVSSILLLPLNTESRAKHYIPGKTYEYLRSYKQILCLGPKGTEMESIISETKSGAYIPFEDFEALKSFTGKVFMHFQKGTEINTTCNIEKYSTRSEIDILDSILKNSISNA